MHRWQHIPIPCTFWALLGPIILRGSESAAFWSVSPVSQIPTSESVAMTMSRATGLMWRLQKAACFCKWATSSNHFQFMESSCWLLVMQALGNQRVASHSLTDFAIGGVMESRMSPRSITKRLLLHECASLANQLPFKMIKSTLIVSQGLGLSATTTNERH